MGWAESKWTVDSIVQKLGQAPGNMIQFIATAESSSSIVLRYILPGDIVNEQGNILVTTAGVMIRKSTTSYPRTPNDGELVLDVKDFEQGREYIHTVSGLQNNQTYYFRAFTYSTHGVFNLSQNEANKASASPSNVERVTINVDTDNTTDFTSATVRLEDNTNSSYSRSITVNNTNRQAIFSVPANHYYRITFSEVNKFTTPTNISYRTSQSGVNKNYNVTYRFFSSRISVRFPQGATVTCSQGSIRYTSNTSGSYTFTVYKSGTWNLEATQGSNRVSSSVSITDKNQTKEVELSFVNIYGISRTVNSTTVNWSRTDKAVGKTVRASIGTQSGHSDFNTLYPWSEMRRIIIGNDVMVKIPEFWYRRYVQGNIEYIKIASAPTSNFEKHPGSGKYIGAYLTNDRFQSTKNSTNLARKSKGAARSDSQSKGSEWGILDLATLSAIQMLYLVEFANNNVQASIGTGRTSSNGYTTGTTDSVVNLTGRGTTESVVYRGIEDLWGYYPQHIDGVLRTYPSSRYNEVQYQITGNYKHYSDDIDSNHHLTSFSVNNLGSTTGRSDYYRVYYGYVKNLGLDTSCPWVLLPDSAGASTSSGYADIIRVYSSGSPYKNIILGVVVNENYSINNYSPLDAGLFTITNGEQFAYSRLVKHTL